MVNEKKIDRLLELWEANKGYTDEARSLWLELEAKGYNVKLWREEWLNRWERGLLTVRDWSRTQHVWNPIKRMLELKFQ